MIYQNLRNNNIKGEFLEPFPRREGGAREKKLSAEKFGRPSEGAAEGGVGGLRRARAFRRSEAEAVVPVKVGSHEVYNCSTKWDLVGNDCPRGSRTPLATRAVNSDEVSFGTVFLK